VPEVTCATKGAAAVMSRAMQAMRVLWSAGANARWSLNQVKMLFAALLAGVEDEDKLGVEDEDK
jgi:hypothetical protein